MKQATVYQEFKALAKASLIVWREKYEKLKELEQDIIKVEDIIEELKASSSGFEYEQIENKVEEIKKKVFEKFRDLGPLPSYDRSSQPAQ